MDRVLEHTLEIKKSIFLDCPPGNQFYNARQHAVFHALAVLVQRVLTFGNILQDLADNTTRPPAVLPRIAWVEDFPATFGVSVEKHTSEDAKDDEPSKDSEKQDEKDSGFDQDHEDTEDHSLEEGHEDEHEAEHGAKPQLTAEETEMVRDHRKLAHLYRTLEEELDEQSSQLRESRSDPIVSMDMSPIMKFTAAYETEIVSDVEKVHNIRIPPMPGAFYNSHPKDTLPYSE
jgi:hypothetical protein